MEPLAGHYDGFIVDLWGVLHDGVRAFPGAVDCLRRLRGMEKQVVVLSNAPRRAENVAQHMAFLELDDSCYTAVVSSGEATWEQLSRSGETRHNGVARRCFHLGPERDNGMRAGLPDQFVSTPEEADYILLTGAHGTDDRVEDYLPQLRQALTAGLPMVCANPDLEVVRGGKREICAGAIARAYEEIGGSVRYYGKPHLSIYRRCFQLMGTIPAARIVAIGDSLRTDIAGARGAGIDAVFVVGGIHAEELGVKEGRLPPESRLRELFGRAEIFPTASLPAFVW